MTRMSSMCLCWRVPAAAHGLVGRIGETKVFQMQFYADVSYFVIGLSAKRGTGRGRG
jgi:hypothetical protein